MRSNSVVARRVGRERDDARFEHRHVGETAERVRHGDRAQVGDRHRLAARCRRGRSLRSMKRRTGTPPTLVTMSKVRSPARYAGDSGFGTPITAAGALGCDADAADALGDVELAALERSLRLVTSTSTWRLSRKTLKCRAACPGSCVMMRFTSSKVRDLFAVDRHDAIAGQQLAVRGMARQHHADRRRQERAVADEHREVEQHREDQVHRRARRAR